MLSEYEASQKSESNTGFKRDKGTLGINLRLRHVVKIDTALQQKRCHLFLGATSIPRRGRPIGVRFLQYRVVLADFLVAAHTVLFATEDNTLK